MLGCLAMASCECWLGSGPVHVPSREKPPLLLEEVIVASVLRENCSKVVKLLRVLAPLTKYRYVKRIKPVPQVQGSQASNEDGMMLEVVVCTIQKREGGGWLSQEDRRNTKCQGEGLWSKVPPSLKAELAPLVKALRVGHVPALAPEDPDQWEDWNQVWPVSYKIPPGKVAKKSATIEVGEDERRKMAAHLGLARDLAHRTHNKGCRNAAVIVNPETNEVVAHGVDETSSSSWGGGEDRTPHPLRHAAMVAVEKVAEGIKAWAAKRKRDSELPQDEPYLCTGSDCYLWREPCAMCAMALVHSRVRRIVFCVPDGERGALGGSFRLHALESLNHHYEVFRWPLDRRVVE